MLKFLLTLILNGIRNLTSIWLSMLNSLVKSNWLLLNKLLLWPVIRLVGVDRKKIRLRVEEDGIRWEPTVGMPRKAGEAVRDGDSREEVEEMTAGEDNSKEEVVTVGVSKVEEETGGVSKAEEATTAGEDSSREEVEVVTVGEAAGDDHPFIIIETIIIIKTMTSICSSFS